MELRDAIYGSGPGSGDLRGVFAPAGAPVDGEKGSVLSTFKGFGSSGAGRDRVLGAFERFGLISPEQRVAGGPVAGAAQGADAVKSVSAAMAGDAAVAGATYANPVYNGLFAQRLMREHGFVPPIGAPTAFASDAAVASAAAADVAPIAAPASMPEAPIAAAADDVAAHVADLEQRLIASFQRLGDLPADAKIPALARAVDAGAAAGHGDDAFSVLARTLAERPIEHSIGALNGAIDEALRVAPTVAETVADDAARVAPTVVDEAAHAAASVAPRIVAAVEPAAAAGVGHLLPSASAAMHGLPGAMSFSAGIDDTLRLLARF